MYTVYIHIYIYTSIYIVTNNTFVSLLLWSRSLDAVEGPINENILEKSLKSKEVANMNNYDINSAKLETLAERHLVNNLSIL